MPRCPGGRSWLRWCRPRRTADMRPWDQPWPGMARIWTPCWRTAVRHAASPVAARPPGGSCRIRVTSCCPDFSTQFLMMGLASARARAAVMVEVSATKLPAKRSRRSGGSMARNCGMVSAWPPTRAAPATANSLTAVNDDDAVRRVSPAMPVNPASRRYRRRAAARPPAAAGHAAGARTRPARQARQAAGLPQPGRLDRR